jgi:hypothetical protein
MIFMEKKKVVKYTEYIFSGVFFTGIFVFFKFFYNSHLHFEEQFQLFLLTDSFFTEKMSFPGGFSGWTGGFLTQFYYLSLAGPFIIAVLFFALQRVTRQVLNTINSNPLLFPLSFMPSLLAGMILCNEFYPLSAITGFLLSMLAGLAYVKILNDRNRFITGLILIPLTYWLAGGSFISLLLLMLAYEFLLYRRSREEAKRNPEPAGLYNFKGWYFIVYILIAAGIPLLVRQFLILQPLMLTFLSEFYYNIRTTIPIAALILFILPALLMLIIHFISVKEKYNKSLLAVQIALFVVLCWPGFKSFANFEAEEIMTYDYFARNERWDDVLKFADKNPPRNYLSLAMVNLSLAKTDQLGNKMFAFNQHGINGLFLSFNREYVTAIMGNEILYQLGLTNASQEYAFESMETIPNMGKSVRVIKRLAETNMINGQYKVSEKYLKLLEKTIFYRKWAKGSMDMLNNEEKINNDPDLGEKRKFMVRNDYFFHIKNIEAVLNRMVKENPENKMAFEYLMAFYMINKDLRNFINLIPVMEKMQYSRVPVSYQEAIMYIIGLNNEDPMTNSPQYVSQDTKLRMKAYGDIYTAYPDAQSRLEKRFSGTYWYYLHFRDAEPSQVEESKNNTGST